MPKKTNVDRRDFVRLMLAGGAGSLAGCRMERPDQTLVSPVDRPEEMIPGKVLEYATVCRACPAGCGVVARTHEARATKLEGLADHPINAGALCARGQAELQHLYSPARLAQPLRRADDGSVEPISWDDAIALVAERLASVDAGRVVVLSRQLGPTGRLLMTRFTEALGGDLVEYETGPEIPMRRATELCFGRSGLWHPHIGRAGMILSFGADFLETWLSPVEQSRGYAAARRYREGAIGLHYQVEPRLSLTGANADEWISIRPGTEHALAMGLLRTVITEQLDRGLSAELREGFEQLARPFTPEFVEQATGVPMAQVPFIARTFSLAAPGLALPSGLAASGAAATATHVAVTLLNFAVGNFGQTIDIVGSPATDALTPAVELAQLRELLAAGDIDVLVLNQTNPVFSLPEGPEWRQALEAVPLVVALATTLDESAAAADLVLPVSSTLESWDDIEPRAGVLGLQQPAMRPLQNTRQSGDIVLEIAAALGGDPAAALPWRLYTDCLRDRWSETWEETANELGFEEFWTLSLQRGGVWWDEPPLDVQLDPAVLDGSWLGEASLPPAAPAGEVDLILAPSLHHYDGSRPNTAWLQEIPDPLAQVSWGPWAEIHPELARQSGIRDGDLLSIESAEGQFQAPALLNRWMQPDVVVLPLGPRVVRQPAAGLVSSPAHLLPREYERASGEPLWAGAHATIRRLGPRNQLLSPRGGVSEEGRAIALAVPVDMLRRTEGGEETEEHEASLYPAHEHPDHRWGMVIDTHACTGCDACSVACYAENNIPVVGREQMQLGREMGWIRLEVYDDGEGAPDVRFLPMLCQQCDNAPCETVCPVFATYHTDEGLNAQIYNRCVGTRYCSNNCPYKVRRFNWLEPEFPAPTEIQLNPNVTVRNAGVMEKCTFCVQRIQTAKHRASDEGRAVRDGDVVPACAQTCPTNAIAFGDLNDPNSAVSQAIRDPRAFTVLDHLNTKPAVHYLKKITVGRRP